ncbi:MAG: MBL fold metallo-hydrolase, partial [Methanomassiliicoccales archaeon]|nr:MBL fold metallo-hydrolase [Methanomassiliicoccales archaeon]
EIAEQYIGSKILLLPVTTPDGNRIRGHLCTDDAIRFIDYVRPDLAVFIHLGIVMLKVDPDKQADKAERATGVKTISGKDLMTLDIDTLNIGQLTPSRPEWSDAWEL